MLWPDYDSRTCLHLAASAGNLHVVNALVEHGAKLSAKDRWGGTPLADALREGHVQVARALRSLGAELLFDQSMASGMLCELARVGDLERVKLMLTCGTDANASDYDRRTCLRLCKDVEPHSLPLRS